ncbi:homoserine O-acetyltransferase [Paraburkholderia fungorum]|uniref:Homoserine O-acetyltransferase n=1 Tax=Paraburkholderia fungorum TaxID=134537 RepID=A0A1H1JHY5_9BURK|nr:alpha/beta fold hydrolase [Paraburkholderia fungorum]SDR49574.1 homoserine O-acetyltransferase [Paraburkholderia fungorum]
MLKSRLLQAAFGLCIAAAAGIDTAYASEAAQSAAPELSADFVAHDFQFSDGTVLPDVRIHYVTIGTPHRDAHGRIDNAVLLMHGTTSSSQEFLTPLMRRELYAPGQPLDAQRYFVVIPDGLGRGGSSKPSDGLRTRFPRYGYTDVVEANHQLLVDGLHVTHLRLVLGVSMGGMQTWMWGERYPDMADALMPVVSQPIAIAGRNWLWRQMVIGAIRNDPDWHNGDYAAEPVQWLRVMPLFAVLTGNPARLQAQAPDRKTATDLYDNLVEQARKSDANDVLYWFDSSYDYNPTAQLNRIRARVLAVNFDDDLLNAVDLDVMQRLIPAVANGRFVEVPETAHSYGHQTQTHPEVWKQYVSELLAQH